MMHELIVSPKSGDAFTKARMDELLRPVSRFISVQAHGWQYANPDTSVTFSIEREAASSTRIACRVPCPRPSFFAREAEQLVDRLRSSVDLLVEEKRTWAESQARAVETLTASGLALPRWTSDDAEVWWRYMRVRRSLLERFDDAGIFAPQVFLFSDRRAEPRIRTAMAWCDAQATLFPVCDLVMILDKSAEPTAWGQDTRLRGFIDRERLLDAMGTQVESVDTDAGRLPVFGAKLSPAGRSAFRQLSVDPAPCSAEFEGITADRPIDAS